MTPAYHEDLKFVWNGISNDFAILPADYSAPYVPITYIVTVSGPSGNPADPYGTTAVENISIQPDTSNNVTFPPVVKFDGLPDALYQAAFNNGLFFEALFMNPTRYGFRAAPKLGSTAVQYAYDPTGNVGTMTIQAGQIYHFVLHT